MKSYHLFAAFLLVSIILVGCRQESSENTQSSNQTEQTFRNSRAVPPPAEIPNIKSDSESPPLLISEFLAANDRGFKDEEGDRTDWIEIFNPGSSPVDLSGFGLTQDRQLEEIWEFPSFKMGAGEYLIVYASGKNRNQANEEWHTDFKLNTDGEFLALIAKEPRSIVHAFGTRYPQQQDDVSYGIAADWAAGEFLQDYESHFLIPSPGKINGDVLFGFVENVVFSVERGFVDQPFSLSMSTTTEGATIRYTTDGTEPTAEQGEVYGSPVQVDSTSVFRAAAFMEGHHPSSVQTYTYLFLADVVRQSPDGLPPIGFPYKWRNNLVDYGMDPRVVDDAAYREDIMTGFRELPVMSIAMDIHDLFGKEKGIYSNAQQDGRKWERSCSVEYMMPGDQQGFEIDCGIRIRGGFSRMDTNPKHSFRLFFRDVYGPSKLEYPLFADAKVKSFDNLDLRTSQNYSWSFGRDGEHGLFVRDMVNRDIQRAMGHLSPNGDFCHLFINGIYWGLYNTCERPEASFASDYLKGGKEDFDVIKINNGRGGGERTFATDGTTDAWKRLWEAAKNGIDSNEAYFRLQGKHADGSENLDAEVLLDVDNLIDYMLVIIWSGNKDAPVSAFMGDRGSNNWYGIRNRNAREGFRFIVWDAEHTMLKEDLEIDRTGPFPAGNDFSSSNPQFIWQQCMVNEEFRMKVADRMHRHFFNDGVLTPNQLTEVFDYRVQQIEHAVICESARWGDSEAPNISGSMSNEGLPLNRDHHWRKVVEYTRNEYLTKRSDIVMAQLFAQGIYPDVSAPTVALNGEGDTQLLVLHADRGEVLYTADGTDPRLIGGQRSASAQPFQSSIGKKEEVQTIKARVLFDGEWSALLELNF
ncbi:CotH kinase family protein [bacterium]|nr:CotH kinase family protein [bacterium]